MLNQIDIEKPNTIGLRLRGKLDSDSLKKHTHELGKRLDDDELFNLYLEVESFQGITFEAVWDSIKLALNNLGDYLQKVDKIAVVTNIDWLKKATEMENKLTPDIKEKVFTPNERELAKVWLEM